MKNVPSEIKLHILSFLRKKQSLGRVSQISKELHVLAKQDVLWSPFLYAKKIDNAKEKYKKILEFSKIKILYYKCTPNRSSYTKEYQVPSDFKFREMDNLKIKFYTPFAIGCGAVIGPHADLIQILKTANCVVINVAEDGYQHFAYYINQLLKISDIKIKDTGLLKAPESIEGFPQIPIIVITELELVDVIREQAKSNNISLYKIIPGKLSPSLESNQNIVEIKNTWVELEKTIIQSILHINQNTCQEIIEEKNTKRKCSLQ